MFEVQENRTFPCLSRPVICLEIDISRALYTGGFIVLTLIPSTHSTHMTLTIPFVWCVMTTWLQRPKSVVLHSLILFSVSLPLHESNYEITTTTFCVTTQSFFTLFLHSGSDVHHGSSRPQWAQSQYVSAAAKAHAIRMYFWLWHKKLKTSWIHLHTCNVECGLVDFVTSKNYLECLESSIKSA